MFIHRLIILFLIMFFEAGNNALSQEKIPLTLNLPGHFDKTVCPTPVWNHLPVVWNGVNDLRSSDDIGVLEKKGKTTAMIYAEPTLAQVIDEALKQLLPFCGLKLQKLTNDSLLNLSVEIEEFYAGVEKKFLTGKGSAQSRLSVIVKNQNQTTQSVEVGFQIESKKVRSRNIKQLEKILNELFFETLAQIPKARGLKDLE